MPHMSREGLIQCGEGWPGGGGGMRLVSGYSAATPHFSVILFCIVLYEDGLPLLANHPVSSAVPSIILIQAYSTLRYIMDD